MATMGKRFRHFRGREIGRLADEVIGEQHRQEARRLSDPRGEQIRKRLDWISSQKIEEGSLVLHDLTREFHIVNWIDMESGTLELEGFGSRRSNKCCALLCFCIRERAEGEKVA